MDKITLITNDLIELSRDICTYAEDTVWVGGAETAIERIFGIIEKHSDCTWEEYIKKICE